MWPLESIVSEKRALLSGFQHIYGASEEIDEKMFIFKVNLGMWPLESIVSEKRALLSGFQHIYGVSEEIDGKMFIFWVN